MITNQHDLRGVKGWLFLLALGFILLSPARGGIELLSGIIQTEQLYPNLINMGSWESYKNISWGVYVISSIISIYTGWSLFKAHIPNTVRLATIALWVCGPLATLVLMNVAYLISGTAGMLSLLPDLAGNTTYAVIWTMYLRWSKRVENTYRAAEP